MAFLLSLDMVCGFWKKNLSLFLDKLRKSKKIKQSCKQKFRIKIKTQLFLYNWLKAFPRHKLLCLFLKVKSYLDVSDILYNCYTYAKYSWKNSKSGYIWIFCISSGHYSCHFAAKSHFDNFRFGSILKNSIRHKETLGTTYSRLFGELVYPGDNKPWNIHQVILFRWRSNREELVFVTKLVLSVRKETK